MQLIEIYLVWRLKYINLPYVNIKEFI